jgi:hypothetical protein
MINEINNTFPDGTFIFMMEDCTGREENLMGELRTRNGVRYFMPLDHTIWFPIVDWTLYRLASLEEAMLWKLENL